MDRSGRQRRRVLRELFRRPRPTRTSGRRRSPFGSLEQLELRNLLANFVVTSAAAEGEGSLADAILQANATVGNDTITFDLPTTSEPILATNLPAITDTVVLDATTQSGFLGTPLVTLRGIENSAGAGSAGLTVEADNSVIRGLRFTRFAAGSEQNGAAITLRGDNNRVEGNIFGLAPDGTTSANQFGVRVDSGIGNLVGGNTSEQVNTFAGNEVGISIRAGNTTVSGNRIGTDTSGQTAMGNQIGIEIAQGEGILIGGSSIGQRNIISGNEVGLSIRTSNNTIQGNYVGTGRNGETTLRNATGIRIDAGSGNLIGGSGEGQSNLISGNGTGVFIASSNNRIQGNRIGTDVSGTLRLANTTGIALGGDMNLVGGTETLHRNLISANQTGIDITGTSNRIEGNWVGLDVNGRSALGNATGIQISEAEGTLIGGLSEDARNIISGNQSGIVSLSARNSLIQGNWFGVSGDGLQPVGNTDTGISILGDGPQNNLIGGVDEGAENWIAASQNVGVLIASDSNFVEGNRIGRDFEQPTEFGNVGGILILGARNQLGSTDIGGANIITGNGYGINLTGADATANQIIANWIGVDEQERVVGNLGDGIQLMAPSNQIGGRDPAQGNVIGGNSRHGVLLQGPLAAQNSVQGNWIGLGRESDAALSNEGNGIHLENTGLASNNLIGGTSLDQGNRIWHNGGAGVAVIESDGARSTGNQIRFNSIARNGGIGIDLGPDGFPDGVTPNDPGDLDEGPNELQNFPTLQSIESGETTRIRGFLDSQPGTIYRIDFYASAAGDADGDVEAERYLGSTAIGPDDLTFDVSLDASTELSDLITAAATSIDDGGLIQGTSEFATLGSIQGTIFNDELADGFTPDDLPLPGQLVELYVDDGDGVLDVELDIFVASQESNEEGEYRFGGVRAGTYFVLQVAGVEFRQTAGGDDFPGVPYYTVAMTSDDSFESLDFANYRLPRLAGRKVIDVDYNGVSEEDPPLENWTIQLFRDDGDGVFERDQDVLFDTQLTDQQGAYEFLEVPPGVYYIVELLDGDYEQTGGGDEFPEIPFYTRTVVGGTVFDDLDFANFDFPDFSGTLYVDLTGDGITEDDDRHPGQTIQLILDDGDGIFDEATDVVVRSTISNLQGDYAFIRVTPGVYFVREIIGENYIQTAGGDEFPTRPYYQLEVQNGVDVSGLDFANGRVASIEGQVFFDQSGDGFTIDDGPQPDWEVELYRDVNRDGILQENVDLLVSRERTDVDGAYRFDRLPPGQYLVFDVFREESRQTDGGQNFPLRPYYVVPLMGGDNIIGRDFANGRFFPSGVGARLLDVGDFDRDGDIDLVLVNEFANPLQPDGNVFTLLNDGTGEFPMMRISGVRGRPHGLTVADFDGDVDPDVAITLVGDGTTGPQAQNRVVTLLSNGDGSFQVGDVITDVGNGPLDLVAADLDNDGDQDLAVANYRSNSVTIIMNQGRGVFRTVGHVAVGASPVSIVAHYLNDDARIDLVVANYGSNSLSLLTNQGNGQFALRGSVPTTPGPGDLIVADFDADGEQDVAVAGYTFDQVEVHYDLRLNQAGGSSNRRQYGVTAAVQATRPHALAAIDYDGDGDLDIAVAGSEVSLVAILENLGGRSFVLGDLLPTGGGPESIAVADLDGNQAPDVISSTLYRFDSSDPSTRKSYGGASYTANRNVDVVVSITNGRSVVVPGERVTYEAVVENRGPSRVENVLVQSEFPADWSDVVITSRVVGVGGGNTSEGIDAIDDTVNLDSGSRIVYQVTGTIDPSLRGEFEVVLRAVVSQQYVETQGGNNRDNDVDDLLAAVDLVIEVDDNGATEDGGVVIPGESMVVYSGTVRNDGPSTASAVTIVGAFQLPAGTAITDFSVSQGELDTVSNRWLVGDLAVGAVATFQATVDVTSDAMIGDVIQFEGSLDTLSEIEIEPSNNQDVVVTRIGPPPEPMEPTDPPEPTDPTEPGEPIPIIEPQPALAAVPAGTLAAQLQQQATATLYGDWRGTGTLQPLYHVNNEWLEIRDSQIHSWGWWSGQIAWPELRVGDVNGDGRDDVAGRTATGKWWVGLASGDTFAISCWGRWSNQVAWHDVALIDVTGDGRADLVGRTDTGAWWVGHAMESSFVNERWGSWSAVASRRVAMIDVDQDGRQDVLGETDGNQIWIALSRGSQFVSRRAPDLVELDTVFSNWNEGDPAGLVVNHELWADLFELWRAAPDEDATRKF